MIEIFQEYMKEMSRMMHDIIMLTWIYENEKAINEREWRKLDLKRIKLS